MAKSGKKRRTWTTEHIRTLTRLARRKTPAARIAKVLKRTESATRQKAFSLGLSLETRSRTLTPKNSLWEGQHRATEYAIAD